jgi:hypothetical protein
MVIGLASSSEYHSDDEYNKAFGALVATFILTFLFSFVFIKVGWLPDFLNINNIKTEFISDKKTTETFAAKKVYRDGDNAIIEDDGGYKIVVNLYGWNTEVYYNGKREDGVKVNGLYWYTSNLNNIKDKNKFVKTKIFKSKDGAIKKVEIVLEKNKHKKDFEVSY